MALILETNYSKKIGLPGYSSHQFCVTLKTEIIDPAQVQAESARLYAVLQTAVDQSLQQHGWLPEGKADNGNGNANGNGNGYERRDDQGTLLNPCATLPPLPIGESEEVVKEGTGAMRVYQEMMFGRAKDDPGIREIYRRPLLQYCELDTAAMVAIWMHWTNAYASEN